MFNLLGTNPTAGSKQPNCWVCPYFTQHWVVFNPPFFRVYKWILMWETTGDGLFYGGSVIMDYEVVFWAWWICFLQKRSFCLLRMLTDGLEWCGLLWWFYQLFGLSFWRHPFTAEHPLLRHWCNATFSKSDEETNSSRVNVHQLFL